MKNFLLQLLLIYPIALFAQDDFNYSSEIAKSMANTKKETKYEKFTSKTGTIIKFYDEEMPKISSVSGPDIETCIRVLMDTEKKYFFRLGREVSYSKPDREYEFLFMVEYSDLVEINKALVRLQKEYDEDSKKNYDHIENKFVTVDGFKIGYHKRGWGLDWFVSLEKYLDHTIYLGHEYVGVENIVEIIARFKDAQMRIEELKEE